MKKLSSAALIALGLSLGGPAVAANHDPNMCHPNHCVPGEDCDCPVGSVAVIGVVPPSPALRGDAPPPCLELVCVPPVIGTPVWIHCEFKGRSTINCEAWPQDIDVNSALEYRWSANGVLVTEPSGFSGATEWRFECGPYLPGPGSTNVGDAIVEVRWKSTGMIARSAQRIDCGSESIGH